MPHDAPVPLGPCIFMAVFCICLTGDDTFPNTMLLVDFLELVTSSSSLVSWEVGPGMSWDTGSLPHQQNQPLFQDLPGGLSDLQHGAPVPWGCGTASPASHLTSQQKVTLLLKWVRRVNYFLCLNIYLTDEASPLWLVAS